MLEQTSFDKLLERNSAAGLKKGMRAGLEEILNGETHVQSIAHTGNPYIKRIKQLNISMENYQKSLGPYHNQHGLEAQAIQETLKEMNNSGTNILNQHLPGLKLDVLQCNYKNGGDLLAMQYIITSDGTNPAYAKPEDITAALKAKSNVLRSAFDKQLSQSAAAHR